MTSTANPTVDEEPKAIPTKPTLLRLKEQLAKTGLVVQATEVFEGSYRVNWFKYDGLAARVVASKFLKVEDHHGELVIHEQPQ